MNQSRKDGEMKGNKHTMPCEEERPAKRRAPPTFPILPYSRFGMNTAPTLRHPLFIGDYSLDEERSFHHDKRNLSFITLDWDQSQSKKVEFDLNLAMNEVKRQDYKRTRKEKINNLLIWILKNRYKFAVSPPQQQNQGGQESVGRSSVTASRSTSVDGSNNSTVNPSMTPITSLSTDFVCQRGLLREIMCSPYLREGWIILATKYRRTIYLCAVDSVEKQAQVENQTENQKRMCSWGYKFEQFMIDGSDPKTGNDENKEYNCVLRSRLASHSLVYGAEVDGADPSRYIPPHAHLTPFIEMKTTKQITTDREKQLLHKFKFQKWWCQSFLVGIPRVVCGFRDETGVVREVQTLTVSSMPSQCQDYWSTDVMINFLDQFLSWVKLQVTEDDPNLVYQLTRPPGSPDVTCHCLAENSPAVSFLPDWYVSDIFSDSS